MHCLHTYKIAVRVESQIDSIYSKTLIKLKPFVTLKIPKVTALN